MANTLREALEEIASGVDRVEPAPELWSRGRRRHRRRVTSGVAAGVVLAALVVGGWPGLDLDRADPPVVEAPESELAIPDAFHDVPRFTRSTSDAGPPGPLAALWTQVLGRGWRSSSDEVVGVSAVDGSYWFVDLPGSSDAEGRPVLSPSGRSIAYLLGGEVPGPGAQSDVVGVAVYDTVTGEVQRHLIESQHGLSIFEEPAWTGDSRSVVLSYGQYTDSPGSADQGKTILWSPASSVRDVPRELSVGGRTGIIDNGLVASTRHGFQVLDPVSLTVVQDVRLRHSLWGTVPNAWAVALGPGDLVAWAGEAPVPREHGATTGGLYVGRLPADGSAIEGRRLLPGRQAHGVIGWLDRSHVLVNALNPRPEGGIGFWAVDVRTGDSEVAIECSEMVCQQQLAVDLLDRPLRHFDPPDAFDPRPWVVLGGLGILGAGWALTRWRRGRPRWT